MREQPKRMSPDALAEFLDTFHRHCALMKNAGGKFVPKHHLWAHMVHMAKIAGNPRFYSTFLDETLNGVVASIAQSCHQSQWEKRLFCRLQLMPLFSSNQFASV